MSNKTSLLLSSFNMGATQLKNRVVMAPMTRGRATNEDLIPTPLMAEYYSQRASAGLIITEGTWVSPNAIGYINVPGIYTPEQVEGWQSITNAVHDAGGKIFLQLGHSGAATHPDLLDGATPKGPSAINPEVKVFTPEGFKDSVTPSAFTILEIKELVSEYRKAAENAKTAGFDGVEIHSIIFSLIPQFLSAATNQRTDEYGGSIENRSRLLFEIIDAVTRVWSIQNVGLKISPAAVNPGLITPDDTTIPTLRYVAEKLNNYPLAYLHIMGPGTDLKDTVLEPISDNFFGYFREIYKGTIIANLGFAESTASAIIEQGVADLVSFGAPYVANPDLVERFAQNLPLATANPDTFYTGEESGYTDYPFAT